MQTTHQTNELRNQIRTWRQAGQRICLVPTMGNLHAGHLALVERAKQLADQVVATIFVNPMQFIQGEDFASYPRTLDQDSQGLAQQGADLLFAPNAEEVYPSGLKQHCKVEVPALDGFLCGASRPGHFTGVATVVSKLFNLVQPDIAIFGEKDYQQLLVIKRMVSDLCIPVGIASLPTVREEDGLAMSSRNGYLSEIERQRAPQIYQLLQTISDQIKNGSNDYMALEKNGKEKLKSLGFEPEYLSVRKKQSLQLADKESQADQLIILIAARLGSTRLIDNLTLS